MGPALLEGFLRQKAACPTVMAIRVSKLCKCVHSVEFRPSWRALQEPLGICGKLA
jgi:hypothetical protein